MYEKNPMPRHLFEGNPVDEGTTRRGTDTPVTRPGATQGVSRHVVGGGGAPQSCRRAFALAVFFSSGNTSLGVHNFVLSSFTSAKMSPSQYLLP